MYKSGMLLAGEETEVVELGVYALWRVVLA